MTKLRIAAFLQQIEATGQQTDSKTGEPSDTVYTVTFKVQVPASGLPQLTGLADRMGQVAFEADAPTAKHLIPGK